MKYSELLQEIKKLPNLQNRYPNRSTDFYIDYCNFPLIRIYKERTGYYVQIVHDLQWDRRYKNKLNRFIKLFDEHGREICYGGGQYKTYRIEQNLLIHEALNQLRNSLLLLPMKEKIQMIEQDFEENEPRGI